MSSFKPKGSRKKNKNQSQGKTVISLRATETEDALGIPLKNDTNSESLQEVSMQASSENPLDSDEWVLTPSEVCQLLKISRSTLDRNKDSIPGRVKIGNQIRYRRDVLKAWLENTEK